MVSKGNDQTFRNFLIAVFVTSALGNQLVCFTLCRTLKKYFPTFYKKERFFIIGITVIMNISMLGRLTTLWWRNSIGSEFNDMLDKGAAEDTWGMPLYFLGHFFVIDFLSSGTLLVSFAFGLSKKQRFLNKRQTYTSSIPKSERRSSFLVEIFNGDTNFDEEDEEMTSIPETESHLVIENPF